LIKTTSQHLLLLVGFDTLIYWKYYGPVWMIANNYLANILVLTDGVGGRLDGSQRFRSVPIFWLRVQKLCPRASDLGAAESSTKILASPDLARLLRALSKQPLRYTPYTCGSSGSHHRRPSSSLCLPPEWYVSSSSWTTGP
jgi:hypothetical protein